MSVPLGDVTLREHLGALIAAEAALTRARFEAGDKALVLQAQAVEAKLGTEVAVIQARFAAMDKALVLQAEAVAIHLGKLNGEQGRLAADRERFLPRESHDLFRDDFRKWQDTVNAQLAVNAGRDRGVGIAWSVGLAGLTLLLGVVGVIITLLLRGG